MNITVSINAPELVNAVLTLASALEKRSQATLVAASVLDTASNGQAQKQQPAPVQTAIPTSVPTYNPAPPLQQAPPQQPVQQQVPTATTTYTLDQLAVAATQLVDAGKRDELLQLLASFGAQTMMTLPPEQYGAFATKLREKGAKI